MALPTAGAAASPTASPTGQTAAQGQRRGSTGHPALKSLRRGLKPVADSKWFVAFMTVVLFLALFLGSFVIVLDFPDDPCNAIVDVLMIVITGIFLFEIFLNCVVEGTSYAYSFFFLADVVGTISMIWEMSFLLGTAGTMRESTSNSSGGLLLLRTARASKVGARAGRMAKLIKVLPIINNRGKKTIGADVDEVEQDAGVMSEKLMFTLSTKVSALTVAFVIFLPLFGIFNFPEADKSTEAWADTLESEYAKAVAELQASMALSVTTFEEAVQDMCHFYDDLGSLLSIFPYRMEGFDQTIIIAGEERAIPGAMRAASLLTLSQRWSCDRPTLNRQQNILMQAVPDCYYARDSCNGYNEARVFFDLKGVSQWEAGFDMLTICFVLLVMVLLTFDLSRVLDYMVLKPLERMLGKYREVAAKIIDKVQELHQDETGSNAGDISGVSEILLLSKAFEKLVRLHDLAVSTNVVDDKELDSMDNEGRAVIEDLMQLGEKRRQSRKSSISGRSRRGSVDSNASMSTQAASNLPVDSSIIDSWEISLLDFTEVELSMVMLYVYFDSSLGCTVRSFMELQTFIRFYQEVERGYMKVPYHNFYHACDTAHTVYRLLKETNADEWVGDLGTMGIMVAALCHDLGHFGMTNAFLVDTGHEWALRYNDKSPLENMHCAQLFKLCQDPARNIFAQFSETEFSEVRKVCVASILHTDMCHHFEMVKEFNTIYELHSDVCEAEAADPGCHRKLYGEQLLQKESMTWLKALLHFADISNPLKPFEVCRAWAMRVLEEFFKQGDEEKQRGIPVGFLNDRDKVNRPGSQHGFINFVVAPCVFAVVRIFPTLHPLGTEMARNLGRWRDMWVEELNPPAEDVAKKDADVAKITEQAATLVKRTENPGPVPRRRSINLTAATRDFGSMVTMKSHQLGKQPARSPRSPRGDEGAPVSPGGRKSFGVHLLQSSSVKKMSYVGSEPIRHSR